METKCILCGGGVSLLEKIPKKLLKSLYWEQFSVDIDRLILDDLYYYSCKECDLRFFSNADGSFPVGDDDFYNILNKIEWYYASQKPEYEFAKNFISEDSKVLEVGCGKAAFYEYLSSGARENYVGLEFSTDAIRQAKARGVQIKRDFIENYAEQHKEQFDRVCSFQVLEHVSNPYSFLYHQIQCLKKGGLLIVAVPSEDGIMRYLPNIVLNCPPHHITRYKDSTLRKIAEIFKLELVDIWHESCDIKKANYQRLIFEARDFIKNDKLFLRETGKHKGIMKVKCIRRLISSFNKKWARLINVQIPNDYGHTVVAVYRKK